MDFITQNLLTILILLPVIGAVSVVGHQMFWKQESHLKWVTLFWALVNFVSGAGALDLGQGSASIAWQAHIGGFIAGFFGLRLFDRKG